MAIKEGFSSLFPPINKVGGAKVGGALAPKRRLFPCTVTGGRCITKS